MEHCEQSDIYAQIGEDLIDTVQSLRWIRESEITVGYLSSDLRKTVNGKTVFGECRKVPAWAAPFIPYDFLVVVYEANCVDFTEAQIKILLHHELLHIGISEKGAVPIRKINPHDVEDFREILDRYGIDWSQ